MVRVSWVAHGRIVQAVRCRRLGLVHCLPGAGWGRQFERIIPHILLLVELLSKSLTKETGRKQRNRGNDRSRLSDGRRAFSRGMSTPGRDYGFSLMPKSPMLFAILFPNRVLPTIPWTSQESSPVNLTCRFLRPKFRMRPLVRLASSPDNGALRGLA